MRTLLVFLVGSLLPLLGGGCSSSKHSGSPASADSPADSGTATTDTGPADSEESELPLEADFVMTSVQLLPSTDGLDLTGDGQPNNALAVLFEDETIGRALGGSPNGWISQSVRDGDLLVLLDFQRLGSTTNDTDAGIDMLLGVGEDGADLFSGSADFEVRCGCLDADGAAASTFESVQVVDGRLSGGPGEFLFLMPFSNDVPVVLRSAQIEGTLQPDGGELVGGILAGAVTYADLEEVVYNDPEIGPDFAAIMLAFLGAMLDVDLDGDRTPDALSAAFRFKAVSGVIDRERPCVDD